MGRSRGLIAFLVVAGAGLALALARPARAGKDDWLPIDPADLALKDNSASPGSHAMILYREEHTDSMKSLVTEYYRIKIFTEEGKNYGDVEIPFVKGQSEVRDIRARTIRPDGSIVNFEGKAFDKEVVKAGGFKVLEKTFSMPEVQPGCIIEYKYQMQYDTDYYWNVGWNVQEDLYTRDAHFTISPPTGPDAPTLYIRQYGLTQTVKPEKQKDGEYAVDLHSITGLQKEDYMLPEDMLRGRVGFYYKSQYSSDKTTEQFWKDTDKSWNGTIDKFVNKKGALEAIVGQTVSQSDSPEVKLQKLYARVQQLRNINYEEKTGQETKREKMKPNNTAEDVLKHGYGYGRDINYLFVGLARAAGFEANEVFLAPRNQSRFLPDLQDTRELTADVVDVKLGTKDVFLDPASHYYPYGILPWEETAVKGLLLNKEGGKFVAIPAPISADATTERHATLQLGDDGSLSGTVEVDFTGIRACAIRQDERDDDETGRRKDMSDTIKYWLPAGAKFEITKTSGWETSHEPLKIEGTLNISGYSTTVGKRILAPLTPFVAPEPRAFQSATRVNDIYFSFPYQQHDIITFIPPSGYQVESLPVPPQISQGAIQYTMTTTKENGGTLRIERRLDEQGFYYPVSNYPAIQYVFNVVKTGDDQQAILERKTSANKN